MAQSRAVGKDALTIVSKVVQPGEELFFRFVYGCIVAKRGPLNNRISGLDELERCFNSGEKIPHTLFEENFPVAVVKLKAFIRDPLHDEPWPVEMVRSFCRLHKGKLPACDSKMDIAQEVDGLVVKVRRCGRLVALVNHFRIRVGRLDSVHSHKGVIYDVDYPEPS